MRDVLRLRRAIHRAIFLAPLAVPGIAALGACAKDDPAKTASVNVPPTGSVAPLASVPTPTAPDAGDDVMPEGGAALPRGRFPRCPSGTFCATKTKIATFADKASPKKLDCPTQLEERDRPDAIDGMPRMKYSRMSLDEQATASSRADGGPADNCCYTWFIPCPGGRPLLSGDRPIVATAREGTGWSRTGTALTRFAIPGEGDLAGLSAEARRAAAEAWQRDALSEHASIASFARATLELLSVGAPPELVLETQRAGMDEVRHASACFDVARALGCRETTPGPLPLCAPRAADLARLARDTFIEGCVGETVSALSATRAAERTTSAVRGVWRLLAADETRHAALAWRTLGWALRMGGPAIGREVLALAEAMRAELLDEADAQAAAPEADAAAFGRLSPRALAAVHHDAWQELIMPTLTELTRSEAHAAS